MFYPFWHPFQLSKNTMMAVYKALDTNRKKHENYEFSS